MIVFCVWLGWYVLYVGVDGEYGVVGGGGG